MEPDYAVALALASDSSTPSAVLERLWKQMGAGTNYAQKEKRVMDAIARNPNLPTTLAPACLGIQAKALAENPALPLLMLECPDIARQSPVERLLRTLRRPDTPAEVLRMLAQHNRPIVAEAARLHVALEGELSEAEVETELRKELKVLSAGGKAKLQELHAWGLIPEWLTERHKLKPATRPVLPSFPQVCLDDLPATEGELDKAHRILENGDIHELSWLLRNLGSKREILSEIIASEKAVQAASVMPDFVKIVACMSLEALMSYYRRGILQPAQFRFRADLPESFYPAMIAEELATLSSSRGLVLVLSIAALWPETQLHEHALSRNWLNRLGVALNPQTPEKDLRRLQKDANRIVRGAATYRTSASQGFGRVEPE